MKFKTNGKKISDEPGLEISSLEFLCRIHGSLKEESKCTLTEVMLLGEIFRGDAKRVTGLPERSARRVLSAIEDEALVVSESHKSPVRFSIPPKAVGCYFPNLYPEGRI